MRVIVIGAGASGMLSAILAAKERHSVILLEKNDRPGKKLMATGNGRCNFLNRRASWVNSSTLHQGITACLACAGRK